MLKWIKSKTSLGVIVLLLAAVSFLWTQKTNTDKELVRVNGKLYELVSRDVKVQTVERIVTEYRNGKTIYVNIPVEVLVPADVDTLSILQDYYTTRVYSDTLKVEDLGYVTVVDTISQNKILGRTFQANLMERTITETITVKELPKLEVWTGVSASSAMQLGGSMAVVTKDRTHFGVDLGLSLQQSSLLPYVGVRYMKQIK